MRTNPNQIRSVARMTDTLAVGLAIRNDLELSWQRLSTVPSGQQIGLRNAGGHTMFSGILSDCAGRTRKAAADFGYQLAVPGYPSRWELGERSLGNRSFQSR